MSCSRKGIFKTSGADRVCRSFIHLCLLHYVYICSKKHEYGCVHDAHGILGIICLGLVTGNGSAGAGKINTLQK
jgi:hypothetical protein